MTIKTNSVILIKHLSVAYQSTPVLWNINLDIPQGVIIGIIGPNGAGKSTLIKTLLGLEKSLTGVVTFFGKSFHRVSHRIAYVPQRTSVDWDFPINVLDVVLMGCYQRLGWIRRPKKSDIDEALVIIDNLGMIDYVKTQIGQLSGGQQQRVFLARALMQKADLYIMDEPFAGIDSVTEKAIVVQLKALAMHGKTVLIVHHDLQTLTDYFDWLIMLNKQIIASGPINTILTKENIQKTYTKL